MQNVHEGQKMPFYLHLISIFCIFWSKSGKITIFEANIGKNRLIKPFTVKYYQNIPKNSEKISKIMKKFYVHESRKMRFYLVLIHEGPPSLVNMFTRDEIQDENPPAPPVNHVCCSSQSFWDSELVWL